jgi:hypothetical protein
MANLVRSGTKQPQPFPVSAADKARLFLIFLPLFLYCVHLFRPRTVKDILLQRPC